MHACTSDESILGINQKMCSQAKSDNGVVVFAVHDDRVTKSINLGLNAETRIVRGPNAIFHSDAVTPLVHGAHSDRREIQSLKVDSI